MGFTWGIFQSVSFEKTQKKVSERRGHFGTHGCAVNLEVMSIIKSKIVHGKNHTNEVTKCDGRNRGIGGGTQKMVTSINTFVMWDIGVEG